MVTLLIALLIFPIGWLLLGTLGLLRTCLVCAVAGGYSAGLLTRLGTPVLTQHLRVIGDAVLALLIFLFDRDALKAAVYGAKAIAGARKFAEAFHKQVLRRGRVCWYRYHRPCTRCTAWLRRIMVALVRWLKRFWPRRRP